MGFALAMVPVMLFPIFRKFNEALALGAVVFRGALEAAIYIAQAVTLLLLLAVSQEYAKAGAMDAAFFQTLGTLLLQADHWLAIILSIVFSLGALMIYYVFYQSKLIPRWLAAWGLVGAVLYLAAPLLGMFGFEWEILMFPLALQEMALAVWLIVRGFNPSAIAFEAAYTEGNGLQLLSPWAVTRQPNEGCEVPPMKLAGNIDVGTMDEMKATALGSLLGDH